MSRLKVLNTPVFWAEGHPGVLDRETWQIEIGGCCLSSRVFTWRDLMSFPQAEVEARLTSVTRFSVLGRWGGVKLSDILDLVGPSSDVTHVRFWSIKEVYDTSVPLAIALKGKTLLACKFDGDWLEEDYGGPVRAFVPYLWGYKSAKSIIRIELMNHYVPGFWEKRGYTDEANIEAGHVRDVNDSYRIRKIPAGEVVSFLDD